MYVIYEIGLKTVVGQKSDLFFVPKPNTYKYSV